MRLLARWTLMVGLLGAATLARADEPRPIDRDRFAANPNKDVGLSSDRALSGGATCGLSPAEEVLVNSLRKRLVALDRREAEILAREAALRTVLVDLQRETARLQGLRAAIDVAAEQRARRLDEACQAQTDRSTEEAREGLAHARATAVRVQEAAVLARSEREQSQRRATELADAAARDAATAEHEATTKKALGAATAADRAAAGASEQRKTAAQREAAEKAKRVAQLAKIVKKMRPSEAGKLLGSQDDATALAVLDAIGDRTAAKLLAQMSPSRSSALAKALVAGGAP